METITLSKEQSTSIFNYRRMGIDIEVLDSDTIKITQSRLINGHILNQKQLVLRAKEAFPGFKVIPVVYSLDVDQINIEWIESKMEEFGIKRNDLIKQLAIDKSSLSLYLSGNRTMDKSQRAAFFFYFLTYELNRDFREVELDNQKNSGMEINEVIKTQNNADKIDLILSRVEKTGFFGVNELSLLSGFIFDGFELPTDNINEILGPEYSYDRLENEPVPKHKFYAKFKKYIDWYNDYVTIPKPVIKTD